MSVKFFTNGNIVDVVNEKVFKGSVLVENGLIKEVGENITAPADAQVVDLAGKTMMPGLFNCHTHVCLAPVAAPTYTESDCQVTMRAMGFLNDFVKSGTVFIRDVGGLNYIDVEMRDEAKKGSFMRTSTSAFMILWSGRVSSGISRREGNFFHSGGLNGQAREGVEEAV